MGRINRNHLVKLPVRERIFVVEYFKDYAVQRAAEAAGYSREYGYKLIQKEAVQEVIDKILMANLEENMIDSDWLLHEMVDNHLLARQMGNISASNTALSLVAKHKRIDAFAAERINVSTDADVVDRLTAARRRLRASEELDDPDFM